MKKYVVTGSPISHSMSPEIYNELFRLNDIDAHYSRLAISNISILGNIISDLGLDGLNITTPFKESALYLNGNKDESVGLTRNANTITIENDEIIFKNTDICGIKESLSKSGIDLKSKKCLILGSGPAAISAANAVVDICSKTTIASRNEVPQNLINSKKVNFIEFKNIYRAIQSFDLIISTVPIGVFDFKKAKLNDKQIVLDAVYHNSDFCANSSEYNYKFISGMNWLYHQAIESFKLFSCLENPILPPIPEAKLQKTDRIAIIGFPGSGKTKLGELLAENLNKSHFDTDLIIEDKEGLPISKIFKKFGEDYFRDQEIETALRVSDVPNSITSFGGGIISKGMNIDILRKYDLVIWLFAPHEICFKRIDIKSRPLLRSGSKEKNEWIFNSRKDQYLKNSDLIVENYGSINDCLDLLLKEINNLK